ncbi:hypothetical protein [Nannocystis pusilla]|uniref:Spheroidene monooxygenase n=1 Tax=Nannocystis pusilla TaxID=889268 RepID=A0ABS7TJC1_9BACT|nr:hypothetical protein [Nannocystis pusilla]MBZ5708323.1 hypothetical protein [Nannocystis pusilla]
MPAESAIRWLHRPPAGATITTVTVLRFPPGQRLWAFKQMGRARAPLAATPGLQFWRLCGTGGGLGFSARPDLSRYALVATWSSEHVLQDFFAASRLFADYRARADEAWTVALLTLRGRGSWGGACPFGPGLGDMPERLPVVALTRARLRLRGFLPFWARVPAINRRLVRAPGLRLALGIGELPWIRPVTFSVWDDAASLEQFAWAGSNHQAAARAALSRRWFAEDLFFRFAAAGSAGTVGGRDPLLTAS